MKKRVILSLLSAALIASSSITAFASPQTMPDGTVFDAEFYAQAYPDIALVYGTTEADVLYQHYMQYGKAEGRLAAYPEQTAAENTQEQDNAPQQTQGYIVERVEIVNDTSQNWKAVYSRNDVNGAWELQWQAKDGECVEIEKALILHNYSFISPYFGAKILYEDGSEHIFETTNIIPGQDYHTELDGFYAGEGTQILTLFANDSSYDHNCFYSINWN